MPIGAFKLNTISAAAAPTSEAYWILTYDGAGTANDQAASECTVVDSSGNIYIALYTTGATLLGSQDTIVIKLNSSGSVQNTLRINNIGSASYFDQPQCLQLVGSDLYLMTNNLTGSTYTNYLHKIATSNLSLTSTYRLNTTFGATWSTGWVEGTDFYYGQGNPGSSNTIGTSVGFIAKSNLSGTVSWTRQFQSTSYYESVADVEFDGSNVYFLTNRSSSVGPIVLSYTSAGANNYQRLLSGTNVFVQPQSLKHLTGLSTMYLSGARSTGGTGIAKIDNTTNGIVWQKYASTGGYGGGIVLDNPTSPSSNIYQMHTSLSSATAVAISKLDSSGTVLWQRQITVNSGALTVSIFSVVANSTNMYVTLTVNKNGLDDNMTVVLKLPADGTKTGNYTVGSYTFNYSSTTISYTTTTWTWATATTWTLSTPTATTQTSTTPTTSSSGLTATTSSIP